MTRRKAAISRGTAIQFGKYLAGGSVYFWSGYAIFALGYSVLHLWWLWAKLAADAIGWTLNYVAQRYWAFTPDHPHLSEMQHVGRYLFIESIGFIVDYAIIAGLKAVGITPYIGFFVSAGFFTVWSYLWYKYWVFPAQ
ncbi:MAG TPA: GtrA family protein [Candidatus Dormibacteraeota bacterium]|nr:GtrA family protein [Candidatus Dormibacteraeota bacterium]